MKKIAAFIICICMFLTVLSGCELNVIPKDGVATKGEQAVSYAYAGIKYNSAFNIFAERVGQINAGNIAGGMVLDFGIDISDIEDYMNDKDSMNDSMNNMMDDYMNMDIDEYINQVRDSMEAAGMDVDEEMIKEMRKNMETVQGMAKDGTLEDMLSQNAEARDMLSGDEVTSDMFSWLASNPLNDLPDIAAMNGYDPENWEKTAEWALSVAEDMATAAMFGVYSPELLKTGGLAVTVYPHPLVLSNYASLICGESPIDALFFYLGALEYEPQNPVLLSNIAMAYYNMDNLDTALSYAELALQYNPECGPALQLKTVGHLRDGNSILAAETLFKSTRDCFDEMTIMLFDDFLEAIGEIDAYNLEGKEKDEFPINDFILELLYEMAKKYVDTEDVNQAKDSPTAQLTIKPFPSFGSAEDVMKSYFNYDLDYSVAQSEKDRELSKKHFELSQKVFSDDGKSEELNVMNNIRQYYAFKVLKAYYEYQYKKRYGEWHYDKQKYRQTNVPGIDYHNSLPLEERLWQAITEMGNVEVAAHKELRDKLDEYSKELTNSIGDHSVIYKRYQIKCERAYIEFYTLCQSNLSKPYNVCKSIANEFIEMDKRWYDEQKQLLEEFWLKAGGVIKYMTDPDVAALCENEREAFVRSHTKLHTYWFGCGYIDGLTFNKNFYESLEFSYEGNPPVGWNMVFNGTVDMYYGLYKMYAEKIATSEAIIAEAQAQLPPPPSAPGQINFNDNPVDVESKALPQYEKSDEMRGFAVGKYSYNYSATEKSWKLPWSEGRHNYITGDTTKYHYNEYNPVTADFTKLPASTYDVGTRAVSPNDLASQANAFAKKVQSHEGGINNAIKAGGKIFETVKSVGEALNKAAGIIGFARAANDVKNAGDVRRGSYVTRDSRNRVIDQGKVHERQVGGDIANVGLYRTTTVTQSKMTGVATKTKTLTYKFKYITSTK